MINERFFPYKYSKQLVDQQETFITFSISLKANGNSTETKSGKIQFYVVTHKNLMLTDYVMTRLDYINTLIDEKFNRIKNENVIKRIKFQEDDEISITNSSFIGYYVAYSFESFNTTTIKSYVNTYE